MSGHNICSCRHSAQSSAVNLQIDQSVEPTRVTIAGSAQSLQLALCMVRDIVAGNFKVLAGPHGAVGRAGWRARLQAGNAACHSSL